MTRRRSSLQKAAFFPLTDWVALGRLKNAEGQSDSEILNLVASRYWRPVLQYLAKQGLRREEAMDLVQSFFVFAIESRLFHKADSRQGKFRNFLLASVKNFCANEYRRQNARKRRPAGGFVSIEHLTQEAYFQPKSLIESRTPEDVFQEEWLRQLVSSVLGSLESEFEATGKLTHFRLFQARVVAPALTGELPPSLEELALQLGLEYKRAANQLLTAKRAFIRLLCREIRTFASSEQDALEEEDDILAFLSLEPPS